MKTLTEEEFYDRATALYRAQRIFIDTGLTDNITHAFIAYQEIFAERERDIFVNNFNSYQLFGYPYTTRYHIVYCPQCEQSMRPRSTEDEDIKTQWVCRNATCDMVLNSEHDIRWWMAQLLIEQEGDRDSERRTVVIRPKERKKIRYNTRLGSKRVRKSLPKL